MYTFFLDACTQQTRQEEPEASIAPAAQRRVCWWTHSHRLHGFDELLALQVLQDLVDLCQREVALKADVSAPDPCRH